MQNSINVKTKRKLYYILYYIILVKNRPSSFSMMLDWPIRLFMAKSTDTPPLFPARVISIFWTGTEWLVSLLWCMRLVFFSIRILHLHRIQYYSENNKTCGRCSQARISGYHRPRFYWNVCTVVVSYVWWRYRQTQCQDCVFYRCEWVYCHYYCYIDLILERNYKTLYLLYCYAIPSTDQLAFPAWQG